jgi:lysophospholipid acyltransferase (LPLAT)-like uncharacterized protein
MLNKIRGFLLGTLVWLIYRVISWTWRVELHEPEQLKNHVKNKTPFVLAHFHGDEIALLFLVQRYKLATMISTSKDGEMMNTIYHLFGGKTSRGSSTRGSVTALKGLIALSKKGYPCGVAVDGPKGPIYEIKPGIFEMSRIMRSEIFAGGAFCESAWRFPRSWNQTYFPKPFAKVVIVWTSPLSAITKTDDPRSPELAKTLQNQLFAAQQHAANLFGGKAR